MSRAFVKEDDGAQERPGLRQARRHPYYVTPDGFERLSQRLQAARAAGNERESESLAERLEIASVVAPPAQPDGAVHFGARVTAEDSQNNVLAYRIVGEDEADPSAGTISWLSPLAQALFDRRPGDRVVWQRPAGNIPLRILSIEY